MLPLCGAADGGRDAVVDRNFRPGAITTTSDLRLPGGRDALAFLVLIIQVVVVVVVVVVILVANTRYHMDHRREGRAVPR